MIPAFVSTRIGLLKPNSAILAAILCNLSFGVGPRISNPQDQPIDQPHLDVLGHAFEILDWFGCHQLLTSHADWPGPDWSTKGPVDLVTILHPSIPRQSNSSLDQLQSGKRGKEGKVKVRGRPNSRAISMGKAGPLYPGLAHKYFVCP